MPTFTQVGSTDTFTGTAGSDPANFTDIDLFSGHIVVDGAGAFHNSVAGAISIQRRNGTFSTDQAGSVVLSGMGGSANGDAIGVTVRTNTDTFPNHDCYFAYVTDAATITVTYGKIVNGTATNFALNSTVTTWANTDVLRLYVLGTTVAIQKNGVDLLSTTDASLSTGNPGICAIQGANDSMRGDDTQFFDVTAGGGPSNAPRMYYLNRQRRR